MVQNISPGAPDCQAANPASVHPRLWPASVAYEQESGLMCLQGLEGGVTQCLTWAEEPRPTPCWKQSEQSNVGCRSTSVKPHFPDWVQYGSRQPIALQSDHPQERGPHTMSWKITVHAQGWRAGPRVGGLGISPSIAHRGSGLCTGENCL